MNILLKDSLIDRYY